MFSVQLYRFYCEKNKIDTVIFMNGVMSANTPMQVDKMKGMFK